MDFRDLSNYGGFIIGILGIFLSVYLYQKGLEKKEPRCYYKTYREIEKLSQIGDSNIQILYKSNNVERVFTSYLWLWNKGKKAINQSDIPPQSSIKIKLQDSEFVPKILDYRILKASRDEINFRITTVNDNNFSIAFDFLDYNDGAVIEIQHTGSNDTEVETEGIILGVPNGIEITNKQSSKSILRIFQRFLFRGKAVTPTRLFVHKSFRQKITPILGYLIMFSLFVGFMTWAVYDINTSPKIRITADRLNEILVSELPQLSNQNIQNILTKVAEKSTGDKVFKYIFTCFIGAYLLLLISLVSAILRQEFSSPVPKSLYFKDGEERN